MTAEDVLDEVPIDYNQAHSAVYQNAMVHVLRSNMGFLVHAMHGRKADGIPTWCIDFLSTDWNSHARAYGWYPLTELLGGKFADLGRTPQATLSHNIDKGTIEVLGSIIGHINHVNQSMCAPFGLTESQKSQYVKRYKAQNPDVRQRKFLHRQYERLMDDMNTFDRAAHRSLDIYFDPNQVTQMLSSGLIWKTMGGGMQPKLYDHDYRYLQDETLHRDYATLERMAQIQFAKTGPFANRRIDLISAISLNLIDKSLFTTDMGYLGHAPTAINQIVEGDLLCMIQGCQVPVILRHLESEAAYRIVTFSWVSNLEDEQLLGGLGHMEKFRLC